MNRGPLVTYEVVWRSGHVERVQAHNCWAPESPRLGQPPDKAPRYLFYGEVNGGWRLILSVLESDLLSIRLLTETEVEQ